MPGPAVVRGEVVTLLGTPGPTAADWATWADTNAHEIVTGLGGRIERAVDTTTSRSSA